jgi:hypothetical protein
MKGCLQFYQKNQPNTKLICAVIALNICKKSEFPAKWLFGRVSYKNTIMGKLKVLSFRER